MARSQKDASVNGNSQSEKKRLVNADSDSVLDQDSSVNRPKLAERTDFTRWRLCDKDGNHTWQYLEDDEAVNEWPQSTADKYFLGIPTV